MNLADKMAKIAGEVHYGQKVYEDIIERIKNTAEIGGVHIYESLCLKPEYAKGITKEELNIIVNNLKKEGFKVKVKIPCSSWRDVYINW